MICQKKETYFYKLNLPRKLKNRILEFYYKSDIEKVSFLIMKKCKSKKYAIEEFITLPEDAIEISNIDNVKISVKYIKFLFKKVIKRKKQLIIIHNHINRIDEYFSKNDFSLIEKYGEYFKYLGGEEIFGALLLNNYRFRWMLYSKGKFIQNIAIFEDV